MVVKIAETWVITAEDKQQSRHPDTLLGLQGRKVPFTNGHWLLTKPHLQVALPASGKSGNLSFFCPFSWHHLDDIDSRAWYVAILVHFDFSTFQSRRMINAP